MTSRQPHEPEPYDLAWVLLTEAHYQYPETVGALIRERLGDKSIDPALRKFLDEFQTGNGDRLLPSDGDSSAPLQFVSGVLDRIGGGRSALCLSGGGIRSATFSLGVLQELNARDRLQDFDFLSTVSGGGYIGAWLQGIVRSSRFDIATAMTKLRTRDGVLGAAQADPVRALRHYSRYLAPRPGLFSLDTWTIATTYIRNTSVVTSFFALLVLSTILIASTVFSQLCNIAANESVSAAHVLLWGGCLLAAVPLGWILANTCCLMHEGVWGWAKRFACSDSMSVCRSLCAMVICLATYASCSATGIKPARDIALVSLVSTTCYGATFLIGWAGSTESGSRDFLSRLLRGLLLIGILAGLSYLSVYGLLETVLNSFFRDDTATRILLSALIIGSLWLGIGAIGEYLFSRNSSPGVRELLARLGAKTLMYYVAIGVVLLISIYGPSLFSDRVSTAVSALLSGFGLLAVRHAYSAVSGMAESPGGPPDSKARALRFAIICFGAVLAIVVACGLSLGAATLVQAIHKSQNLPSFLRMLLAEGIPPSDLVTAARMDLLPAAACCAAIVVALLALFDFTVDLQSFSMHDFYRMRLLRAYLGSSNQKRAPNPFTNFDEKDDFPIAELLYGRGAQSKKLYPIINATMNLTRGYQIGSMDRRGLPFSMTPHFCGSPVLRWEQFGVDDKHPQRVGGFRPSNEYGGGIKIGTAMAISGAAANPNSGYHHSGVMTMLMTVFNARLGMWLGNPAVSVSARRHFSIASASGRWRRPGPRCTTLKIWAEALGNTDSNHHYVNLSDGGHFDNLGLYEVILRRCRRIVVVDGSADPDYEFDDLARTLQKIRIDLGIHIEIDPSPIKERRAHYVRATIPYPRTEAGAALPGELIYIKAVLTGDEPIDLLHYRSTSDSFPQEPTSNQFFTESQFEAYRMLGQHSAEAYLYAQRDRVHYPD